MLNEVGKTRLKHFLGSYRWQLLTPRAAISRENMVIVNILKPVPGREGFPVQNRVST